MTNDERNAIATLKFSSYTTAQCEHALADIHATLAIQGPSISEDYKAKLYSELDAARERQRQLNTVRSRSRATELMPEAMEVIRLLLETRFDDPLLPGHRRRAQAVLGAGKVWLG